MADNEKIDIAYLNDIKGIAKIPDDAVVGDIVEFGQGQNGSKVLKDSGKKKSDFVESADLPGLISQAISGLNASVVNEYAIAAYASDGWESGHQYALNDFCLYDGAGYMCNTAHTSSSTFDPDKWDEVLTSDGKNAIDSMLEAYGRDGSVFLNNIAPQFSGTTRYYVNDLVIINGRLNICTQEGIGDADARFSDNTNVEQSISNRISALSNRISSHVDDTSVHVSSSDRENWNGKQDEIEDLSDIRSGAEAGTEAASRDKVVIENGSVYAMKPDGTGSIELSTGSGGSGGGSYRMVELVQVTPDRPTEIAYQLVDRAINIINVSINDGRTIELRLPSSHGVDVSRDFYVVLDSSSNVDVQVGIPNASLNDFAGGQVSLVSKAGDRITYKFAESSIVGSMFLVTCFADPTYQKIGEIERALDDILNGAYIDYVPGLYLKCDADGLYYRVNAVTDGSGEISLGIDQNGTEEEDGFPDVYAIDRSTGLRYKLVAVKDSVTGDVDIGVDQTGVR